MSSFEALCAKNLSTTINKITSVPNKNVLIKVIGCAALVALLFSLFLFGMCASATYGSTTYTISISFASVLLTTTLSLLITLVVKYFSNKKNRKTHLKALNSVFTNLDINLYQDLTASLNPLSKKSQDSIQPDDVNNDIQAFLQIKSQEILDLFRKSYTIDLLELRLINTALTSKAKCYLTNDLSFLTLKLYFALINNDVESLSLQDPSQSFFLQLKKYSFADVCHNDNKQKEYGSLTGSLSECFLLIENLIREMQTNLPKDKLTQIEKQIGIELSQLINNNNKNQ